MVIRHIKNNRGLTLIEVMVVLAIMGILSIAMSQLLVDSKKFQTHIELKTETVDFKNTMNLSVNNSESCKVALGIEEDPTVFPKSQIPVCKDGACSPATVDPSNPYPVRLKRLMAPGRQIYGRGTYSGTPFTDSETLQTPGSDISNRLTLDDIRLEFLHPMSKTGDGTRTYIANLMLKYGKKAPGNSIGLPYMTTRQPLMIEVEEQGSDFKIKDCFIFNNKDSRAVCKSLGGTWLSNTNNAQPTNGITRAMCNITNLSPSTGRCVFSSSYELQVNENPDGISCFGEMNTMNERPEFCRFTKSGKVNQVACPSRPRNSPGKKCIFTGKEWKYVNQLNANPNNYRPIASCDQGIDISRAPEGFRVVNWDRSLADEFNLQSEPFYKVQTKYLGTVSRCLISPKNQTFKNCINPDNIAGAMAGKAGSCIFVKDVNLYPKDTARDRIIECHNVFSASNCPSLDPASKYTGWVYVSEDRQRSFQKENGGDRTKMAEATGLPCFEVEVMSGAAENDEFKDPVTTFDKNNYPQGPIAAKIAQCIYKDSDGKEAMFLCRNETTECNPIGSGDCDRPRDAFNEGSCWFASNAGVKLKTRKGELPNQWFYFRSEPPGKSDLKFTVDRSLDSPPGSTADPTDPVNGVQCLGGVRFAK